MLETSPSSTTLMGRLVGTNGEHFLTGGEAVRTTPSESFPFSPTGPIKVNPLLESKRAAKDQMLLLLLPKVGIARQKGAVTQPMAEPRAQIRLNAIFPKAAGQWDSCASACW